MFGDEQIVTKSAAKQIAEHIRTAILEGRLKGDERLPTEEELAARYGVSRPTVREALKRLAAQNLISSKRGPAGGTFVNSLSLEELADGRWQNVIGEVDALDAKKVRRVLLCSGKVYYELLAWRREQKIDDIAILRIEQQYPFPHE